jgi:two-component system, chemotaxis family, response regulator Rcp1
MKEVHILLVEDNEGDILLTKEALKEVKITNKVSVATDGEQALEMLRSGSCLPDMIFMDINLPKMDGLELLGILKSDDRFKMIPVIMLTTSSGEKDIIVSYKNYANCFVTKPVDLKSFIEVVKTIESFWISIVRLPPKKLI